MNAGVRFALQGMTGAGWLIVVANTHPAVEPLISMGQLMLAACIAVAGTLACVVVHVQRPVQDIWQAGREHGRREAIREARGVESMASLDAGRRRRRAVARRREEHAAPAGAPALSRQGIGDWSG